MKLEEQVCSLELAKRLKELGVKQESYLSWAHVTERVHQSSDGERTEYVEEFGEDCKLIESGSALWNGVPSYSAFTVAELGEMLPETINDGRFFASSRDLDNRWGASYGGRNYLITHADTEADARAVMLVYLLENNLLQGRPPENKT